MNRKILQTRVKHYPTYPRQETTSVTTVLVRGVDGKIAAYEGIGPEQWIASWGNKISFEAAKLIFSSIKEENYRN